VREKKRLRGWDRAGKLSSVPSNKEGGKSEKGKITFRGRREQPEIVYKKMDKKNEENEDFGRFHQISPQETAQ